ncbi:MAG: hypothetical protein MUO97_00975, partial [Dehalococcoidia bacterium]|nr:hypothetical protein [Dehalococcoidia bacterium]
NPLPRCTIIRLSKLAVKIDVSAGNSVSMAPEVGFEPTTKYYTLSWQAVYRVLWRGQSRVA